MYIELMDVVWLTVIASIGGIWWHGFKVKERALAAVRKRCEELDLQFLDQNVALRSIKLKRTTSGQARVYRVYGFEFSSTGEERYRGYVTLLGMQVQEIIIEPHRLH
ncbi:hypothetical protein BTA51_11835 [Hahella sp. CCB-MM4]|uniref:DUF3301 domain-containing protein n=1 Tax=Hahella sp. (strain CCB-MM4) TaxID=1926491 RepID=UPI000B9A1A35|nr:DUF3301 domain-containing protein [Hahella sp. CCB-MM4]OZG73174.1 hypothetical protein BTA51_11835 [Hahella sp. CCB-MM4]